MRLVNTTAERDALIPQFVPELILVGTTLYVSVGLTAGAWSVVGTTAVTQNPGDNSTKLATTEYADRAGIVTMNLGTDGADDNHTSHFLYAYNLSGSNHTLTLPNSTAETVNAGCYSLYFIGFNLIINKLLNNVSAG